VGVKLKVVVFVVNGFLLWWLFNIFNGADPDAALGNGIALILWLFMAAMVNVILIPFILLKRNRSKKNSSSSTTQDKLDELFELRRKGQISEEEYEQARKKILDNI